MINFKRFLSASSLAINSQMLFAASIPISFGGPAAKQIFDTMGDNTLKLRKEGIAVKSDGRLSCVSQSTIECTLQLDSLDKSKITIDSSGVKLQITSQLPDSKSDESTTITARELLALLPEVSVQRNESGEIAVPFHAVLGAIDCIKNPISLESPRGSYTCDLLIQSPSLQ